MIATTWLKIRKCVIKGHSLMWDVFRLSVRQIKHLRNAFVISRCVKVTRYALTVCVTSSVVNLLALVVFVDSWCVSRDIYVFRTSANIYVMIKHYVQFSSFATMVYV